jgi:hypothetical protein
MLDGSAHAEHRAGNRPDSVAPERPFASLAAGVHNPPKRIPTMPCKGTLVVENDANGKLVKWELRCEGKCGKRELECATQITHLGGSLMYYCACEEGKEDDDVPDCRFQVHSSVALPTELLFMCLGRCGKDKKEPCRPLVVKKYEIIPTNKEHHLELDPIRVHTVRHITCTCHSEII